jgi:uncharacterized protein YbcI
VHCFYHPLSRLVWVFFAQALGYSCEVSFGLGQADLTRGEISAEIRQADLTRGEVAAEISTTIVQMLKEHAGRGPTKCRTYIDDDHVMVLMMGGYTRFESTLFADGKFLDVRSARHAFQDTMEGRLTELIERKTGRQVAAFMSASHQQPDLQVELFLFADQASPPEPTA